MSEKQKYTEDGLPIVSGATAQVFLRDIVQRVVHEPGENTRQWLNELVKNFSRENPNLAELVQNYFRIIKEPASILPRPDQLFYQGAFITYEVLRRQVEANKLEESIN